MKSFRNKEKFTETPQGGAKSGPGVKRANKHHNPDKENPEQKKNADNKSK